MNYTTKEEYQEELKTFKEVYFTHLNNQELKNKCADIIAWYEEQIALIERIAQYAKRHLADNTADKRRIICYP